MTTQDEPVATLAHMRQLKLCASGGRAWAKHHGLDWGHFVRHGYPASTFAALGDAYGDRMAALARGEEGAK